MLIRDWRYAVWLSLALPFVGLAPRYVPMKLRSEINA